MKIGDTVWIFDSNHRVYQRDAQGRAIGSPIYREHWQPAVILGETAKSWLLGWNSDHPLERAYKLLKSDLTRRVKIGDTWHRFASSILEVDADVWAHQNRYDIVRFIECCDVATLRKVADVLGFWASEKGK